MKLPDRKTMTAKEFREAVGRIRLSMMSEVGGWPRAQATKEAKAERLELCRHDPFAFDYTYLPHYFSSPPAPFHRELVDLLAPQGPGWAPVIVAAPRGFAKTTLISFGWVLHQAIFAHRHFIILGSDTADLAEDLTSYLRLELIHNERLRFDFGDKALPEGGDADFVVNNARILARGRGQRIRGFKHGPHRPDAFLGDDLENDKMLNNPRLVQELQDWLTRAVMPALDERRGAMFIIGTIIAKASALSIMIRGQTEPFNGWTRRLYRALNTGEDGKQTSLWPQRFSVDDLLQQKARMGSKAFNQEKQNDPQDEESSFQGEWIEEHAFSLGDVPAGAPTVGFLDPSISEKSTADPRAIVVLAKDKDGSMLVVDAYIRRDSLQRVLLMAYELHAKWHFYAFGVETNLFQKLLLNEFDQLALTQGYLPVRGVDNFTNKQARINALSPGVERGRIRFLKAEERSKDYQELVDMLMYFPSYPHDDGPDALEGAVSLMGPGGAPQVW